MINLNASKTFSKQQYPESFSHRAKLKAIKIHKHISYNKDKQPNLYIINPIKRHILFPQNPTTTLIEKNLHHLDIKTVTRTTKTIKQLLKKLTPQNTNSFSDTGIYKISCLGCQKLYILGKLLET